MKLLVMGAQTAILNGNNIVLLQLNEHEIWVKSFQPLLRQYCNCLLVYILLPQRLFLNKPFGYKKTLRS